MAVSVDQFGKALVSSGLMTAEEVKSFWKAIPAGERPKDAEAFVSLLVQGERLNAFQADEILTGSKTPLVLGDYVLLSKIGEGGMGQVFKAEHRHMKRLAAIKLLPSALTKDEAAVKRFQREVQAAAKLSNPNIVQTHDAGVQRGIWYLVMEFVDGSDLSAIVRKSGPLSVHQAADYILQTARGLAFAHSKGVVHRDIKPANLLLDNEGVIKILDMGLARIDGSDTADHQLTNSGIFMGTVDYMSPEQATDTRRADARSDVYSLGCTFYRLLTGESVYGGETVIQKIMAHLNEPIPMLTKKRPDVSSDLDRIFRKMMAKKPEDRYQQASQVVAALEAWRNPGATVSFSNQVVKSQDFNASDFSIGVPMPSSDVAATSAAMMPLLKQTAIAETEETSAFTQAELKTDPKSEILASQWTGAPPSPSPKPAVGGNRNKMPPIKLIAAGAAGFLILLLGVILVIKNDKGETVAEVKVADGNTAEVKVPAGGSVQVKPDVATAATGPKATVALPQSVPTTPAVVATASPSTSSLAPNPTAVVYLDDLPEVEWKILGDKPLGKHGTYRDQGGTEDTTILWRGKPIAHSLWMHPPRTKSPVAFARYQLDGRFATFAAEAGIQESTGKDPQSPVAFRVLGDGRELWKSPPMQKRGESAEVSVDVRGVKELRLETSSGDKNGNCHATWFMPRLTPAPPGGLPGAKEPSQIERLLSADYEWSEPESLGPVVNAAKWNGSPTLSGDQLCLIVMHAFGGGNKRTGLHEYRRQTITEPWSAVKQLSDSNHDYPSLDSAGLILLSKNEGAKLADGKSNRELVVRTRSSRDAPWGPVTPLATLNTLGSEDTPAISPDGLTLVFSSNRPGSLGVLDLWISRRVDLQADWETPVSLGSNVNSVKGERASQILGDSKTILFGRNGELFLAAPDAQGVYDLRPVPLPTNMKISKCWLSPDGATLYFASGFSTDSDQEQGAAEVRLMRRVRKASVSPLPVGAKAHDTALQFDGGDLVEVPTFKLDPKLPHTLEGFITAPAKADQGAGTAFGFENQSNLDYTVNDDWRWVYVVGGKSQQHSFAGAPSRQARTHIACVRDGQTNRLYVDGKLFTPKKTTKNENAPDADSGESFAIGLGFRGLVDEVRVSKVARYKADFTPPARFEPDADTLGLYHCDEGMGDVLKDSSGNDRHGKITGARWVKADGGAIASSKLFMHDPAFQQWANDVQAMPADKQIEAVSRKLMELNPGFDGTLTNQEGKAQPRVEKGTVMELEVVTDNVTDLSPVRALVGLESLTCTHSAGGTSKLSDLSPLKQMTLTYLKCTSTQVSDLTPLKGMPLKQLICRDTLISDLTPVADFKGLRHLNVSGTKVTPASVAALQKALPNCKIEWDDPAKAKTQPAAAGSK